MTRRTRLILILLILASTVLPALPIRADTRPLQHWRLTSTDLRTYVQPVADPCAYSWKNDAWTFEGCYVRDSGIWTTLSWVFTFQPTLTNIVVHEVEFYGGCYSNDAIIRLNYIEYDCIPDPDHPGFNYYGVLDVPLTSSVISGRSGAYTGRPEGYTGEAENALLYIDIWYYADDLPPVAVPAPNLGIDGQCKSCVYAPKGDWFEDAGRLIDYLACQIGNIYYCHVIPILLGIWRSILNLIILFQSFIYWIISAINQVALWFNGSIVTVARFGQGALNNATTTISSAVFAAGGTTIISNSNGGANLFDVLIEFIRQVGGAIGKLVDVFPTLISAFRDISLGLINLIVQLATLLINVIILVINFILLVLAEIFRIAMLIPQIFTAMADGFTATVSLPPSVAPAPNAPLAQQTLMGQPCDSEGVFPLCLGIYVLDNTVFSGGNNPVGVIGLVYFFEGVAALRILFWFVRKFSAKVGGGSD